MAKKKETLEFEAAFTRLEDIVAKLESGGESSLDDSLKYYQEGMELVQSCTKKLESAEQSIKQLTEDSEGNSILGDFDEKA
ncbi:MAG: exodeoxyribonuclease VII small subunit [Candidatus Marinimicrobia bacterium]|nr:exodeoxyribonuclease VII small subunit [Candidatus Neomarinimicrobiota bacterium]